MIKFQWFSCVCKQNCNYSKLYSSVTLRTNWEFFWQLFNLKKACFFAFTILRCFISKKKAFTWADRTIGVKQCYVTSPLKFTLLLSKFLRNQEQMRLNIGKKLKKQPVSTQGLPVLKRKNVLRLAHVWKFLKPKDLNFLLTYEFTHQQPQGRFTSLKKIIVWKKLFLSHIDPKI